MTVTMSEIVSNVFSTYRDCSAYQDTGALRYANCLASSDPICDEPFIEFRTFFEQNRHFDLEWTRSNSTDVLGLYQKNGTELSAIGERGNLVRTNIWSRDRHGHRNL
jgi:hypothetical protein